MDQKILDDLMSMTDKNLAKKIMRESVLMCSLYGEIDNLPMRLFRWFMMTFFKTTYLNDLARTATRLTEQDDDIVESYQALISVVFVKNLVPRTNKAIVWNVLLENGFSPEQLDLDSVL